MPQLLSSPPEKERVKITNIVAKSLFFQPFSFSQLDSLPLDDSNAYQPRFFLAYKNVKFSILHSGTVLARAASSFDELQEAFDWLRQYAQTDFKLQLSPSYQISNIVAVAFVSTSKLNLINLAPLLPHSSYDPSPILFNSSEHLIDSIVFRFNSNHNLKPCRTALIFRTGNATFTGFFSFDDLLARVSQLSSLISQIAISHPEIIMEDK